MKQRLKKLTAMLLSISMVVSMFTAVLPNSRAEGEGAGGSTPSAPKVNNSFSKHDETGRPGLYVDFLGDNKNYVTPSGEQTVYTNVSGLLAGLSAPGKVNQSVETNPYPEGTTGDLHKWARYGSSETYTSGGGTIYDGNTIFWVGVGIDHMNALDLFRQDPNTGLYSLELAFYYDSEFIEPYTGPTGGQYKEVIEAANLTDYADFVWNGYSIIDAQTDLLPQTDPVTQEVIKQPRQENNVQVDAIAKIMDRNSSWRMTYVSLERTADGDNRFKNIKYYYNEANPENPDALTPETQYLMLIPFRLKKYDPNASTNVCLRLARNAGLLSIGGGTDGVSPYAAWERVTVRNPDRELKLMTDFQGDLVLFKSSLPPRYLEEPYEAELQINDASGGNNEAVLSITNDPSPVPVTVNKNGDILTGIYGGTGMTVDITMLSGYKVTVEVYYEEAGQKISIPVSSVWSSASNGKYTYIMPEHNVIVDVKFELNGAREFQLYLNEMGPGSEKESPTVKGNYAILTSVYTEEEGVETEVEPITTVDRKSPLKKLNNEEEYPAETVMSTSDVTMDVDIHNDYEAVIRFFRLSVGDIEPENYPANATFVDEGEGEDKHKYLIMPTSGTVTIGEMPQNDLVVHVTYRLAQTRKATLEIWHDPDNPGTIQNWNVAQLHTLKYTNENTPVSAYTGVVYEKWWLDATVANSSTYGVNKDVQMWLKDGTAGSEEYFLLNHSAVKENFRVIEWVDASTAVNSGSLGGDGHAGLAWDTTEGSMMALAYAAVDADDLKGTIIPHDLRKVEIDLGGVKSYGLRKNAMGEYYSDKDIGDFYAILLKVNALAKEAVEGAAPEPGIAESQQVTGTENDYYYDVTPAQVQMYILDLEAYEKALVQYAEDKAAYDEAKAEYDKSGIGPAPVEPTKPTEPGLRLKDASKVTDPGVGFEAEYAAAQAATAAEALKAFLANPGWYKPSYTTVPPTAPELEGGKIKDASTACFMETRPGRRVALALEADSAYTEQDMIESIVILDARKESELAEGETLHAPIYITADPAAYQDGYQNVYFFDMPDYDCTVRVTYTPRGRYDLDLIVEGTDEVEGNEVTMIGYTAGENGSPSAKAEERVVDDPTDPHTISAVLEGSTVKVKVKHAENYSVSAEVIYYDPTDETVERGVTTVPGTLTNLSDGSEFTFSMPKGKAEVRVTYTRTDQILSDATLVWSHYTSETDSDNRGVWHGTTLTKLASVAEGTELQADINVAEGYYIYSAEAYTATGNYPLVLSGNGWNNGAGGSVTIRTVMPNADYTVHVIYRKGPPEPEPDMSLMLQVKDPRNKGVTTGEGASEVTTYDDNYAGIIDPAGAVTGWVGLAKTGPDNLTSSTKFVKAGDIIKVEFHPAVDGDGKELYYVSSVQVEPASLGAVVVWTSPTTAEFVMPAGSASVVVTFEKGPRPAKDNLHLFLAKTETGAAGTADNTVEGVASDTLLKGGLLTGNKYNPGLPPTWPATTMVPATEAAVAVPGEKVSMMIKVAPGWYVYSLTVTGKDGRIAYDLTDSANAPLTDGGYNGGAGGTINASFIMQNSDATVVVNYRKGPPPDVRTEYQLELVVTDPDNEKHKRLKEGGDPSKEEDYEEVWYDNKAKAAFEGTVIGNLGLYQDETKLRDSAYAKAGDVVTLTYSADTGYAMDIIIVTPSGLRITPTYVGGGKARFTMPSEDITVEVRFKKGTPNEYTANLVLHMPAGTLVANYDTIGRGSLGSDPAVLADGSTSRVYSMVYEPGDTVDFVLLAKDGYYIEKITVNPAVLGVDSIRSGSFGYQDGSLIMPAANVQINVYFAAEWPDNVRYDLTLAVYDSSGKDSSANFASIGQGAANPPLTASEKEPVYSGERKTLTERALDEDRVVVHLDAAEGCHVKEITVVDGRGRNVPWSYVPEGIAFYMPPSDVTVTVRYAEGGTPAEQKHDITLKASGATGADLAKLATGASWVYHTDADATLKDVPAGAKLTLTTTLDTDHSVRSAYAIGVVSRNQLLMPVTIVAEGGTATFAMPDENAEATVIFANVTPPHVDPTDPDAPALGMLIVTGPAGSGSAVMTADTEDHETTGNVAASGAGSLFVKPGTALRVDLTVNPGYQIAAVRVTDGNGDNVPYTWTDGTQRHMDIYMPVTGGVQVYVEYKETDAATYTAQVVVNNGGGTGNTALLRLPANAVGSGKDILRGLSAGDVIDLDLTRQLGYEIEYIKVVPAELGIAPAVVRPEMGETATTSFVMPAADVVIYVKFASDGRDRWIATLKVTGAASPDENNRGYISSAISGTKGPEHPGDPWETVYAASASATEPAEWVTVDYQWADGWDNKHVEVTVETTGGVKVPFTQLLNTDTATGANGCQGHITFPMVDANVNVTVNYLLPTDPPKLYDAVLHVIDMDNETPQRLGYSILTETGDASNTTGHVHPNDVAAIQVPAGDKVTVDSLTYALDPDVYIYAAYVLYREGGQMIEFNFKNKTANGFKGPQQDTFVMHPGINDVYVYYTQNPPAQPEYAAVIMIDSPEPGGEGATTATIRNKRTSAEATVVANNPAGGHDYVTGVKSDTITVVVTPADGYSVESILLTPLGVEYAPGVPVALSRDSEGNYVFTMPDSNVAVHVQMKVGSAKEYTATLHYGKVEGNTSSSFDWASMTFTAAGITTTWKENGDSRKIPEETTVTLGASITGSDLVLAAYVLQSNGDIVPLAPAMEGLRDTVLGNTTVVDAEATFSMPASDVDVFVWFSDKAPAENWRTAVLTVTDSDINNTDGSNDNSGLNQGDILSDWMDEEGKDPIVVDSFGVPAHASIWVTEGEKVTVSALQPAANYIFSSATLSNSATPADAPSLNELTVTQNKYIAQYDYTVGGCNTAVVIHFQTSAVTQNTLTVKLIDKDNPGTRNADGSWSVSNRAEVVPGTLAPLTVVSTTAAGARQQVRQVTSGTGVTYTVTPEPGYSWAARLRKDADGTVTPLTELSFTMPNQAATLEIIFFKPYSATLTIDHLDGNDTGSQPIQGQMTESALSRDPAEAILAYDEGAGKNVLTEGKYDELPNGTVITAGEATENAMPEGTRLVGFLAEDRDGTRWLPAQTTAVEGIYEYKHTLNGKDATIHMVVQSDSTPTDDTDNAYLVTIRAEDLPDGANAPKVQVKGAASWGSWTKAYSIDPDTIVFKVDVPEHYKADVTAKPVTGGNVAIYEDDAFTAVFPSVTGAAAGKEGYFPMPAANVEVVVKYTKTVYDADIRIEGGSAVTTATLTQDDQPTNTTTATNTTKGHLTGFTGGENLTYSVTPDANLVLTAVLATKGKGGGTERLLTTTGSYTMPADDVLLTVVFDKPKGEDDPKPSHYIAFVSAEGQIDDLPENAVRSIVNRSDPALGGGTLWRYGDQGHRILVSFDTAPGYTAVVTAETAHGVSVPVLQQGTTGSATAEIVMPGDDVKIIVKYYGPGVTPPAVPHTLKLILVGPGGEEDNSATLTGGAAVLKGSGKDAPTATGVMDEVLVGTTTAKLGDPLDVDAAHHENYVIERITIKSGGVETEINVNEYLNTATALMTMPDADAEVRVYYHLYFKAQFTVTQVGGGLFGTVLAYGDTTDGTDDVPTVTLEAFTKEGVATGDPTSTQNTYEQITTLGGEEKIIATITPNSVVNTDHVKVASVVATTTSGTVHLLPTVPNSGIYEYQLSTDTRRADDVTINVIMWDDEDPAGRLHTATVYMEGHDNKSGNTVPSIADATRPGMPYHGTIWTGAYEDDEVVVEVTTHTGYYAVITAVNVETGDPVPVLQWIIQSTAAERITGTLKMPDADVDITVTFTTTKPEFKDLTLYLKDHGDDENNKGQMFTMVDDTTKPDLTDSSLMKLGTHGADTANKITTVGDPREGQIKVSAQKVEPGIYFWDQAYHDDAYFVKSMTLEAAGFVFDLTVTDNAAISRMPFSDASLTIEFAPGRKTPRPYDPDHHEVTAADEGSQEGWLLAKNLGESNALVTVPNLYDKKVVLVEEGDPPVQVSKTVETLYDSNKASYQFYLPDPNAPDDRTKDTLLVLGTDYVLELPGGATAAGTEEPFKFYEEYTHKTDLFRTSGDEKEYTGVHYVLKEVEGGKLADKLASGLTLWVTANLGDEEVTETVDGETVTTVIHWIEGEKTELIIPAAVGQPSDPKRLDDPDENYDDRWIRAENRGDYMIVTVPTLANADGSNVNPVDGDTITFGFHLEKDGDDHNRKDTVSVTDLITITNPEKFFDPDWTAPTGSHKFVEEYESDVFYTDLGDDNAEGGDGDNADTPYDGARFIFRVKSDEDIEKMIDDNAEIADADKPAAKAAALANAAILRELMDNYGTMSETHPAEATDHEKPHRLYITAIEVKEKTETIEGVDVTTITRTESGLADFEVPRYYTLTGAVLSWAPTHTMELNLYRYDGDAGDYEDEPFITEKMAEKGDPKYTNGRWQQTFKLKSSELKGETYRLKIEKAAHVTYIRDKLEMDTAATNAQYDADTLTFTVKDTIELFCGDLAPTLPGPDGRVNDQDRNLLSGLIRTASRWSTTKDDTDAAWSKSVFNPKSLPYAADLDGDGRITERDMTVLMSAFNFRKSTADYGAPEGLEPATMSLTLAMDAGAVESEKTPETEVLPSEDVTEDKPDEDPGSEPDAKPEGPEAPVETVEEPEQMEQPEELEIPEEQEESGGSTYHISPDTELLDVEPGSGDTAPEAPSSSDALPPRREEADLPPEEENKLT